MNPYIGHASQVYGIDKGEELPLYGSLANLPEKHIC